MFVCCIFLLFWSEAHYVQLKAPIYLGGLYLGDLERQLHNTVRVFQWLSQTFHSNITNTCCSVIPRPAVSIYNGTLASSNLEEKETPTLTAAKCNIIDKYS